MLDTAKMLNSLLGLICFARWGILANRDPSMRDRECRGADKSDQLFIFTTDAQARFVQQCGRPIID